MLIKTVVTVDQDAMITGVAEVGFVFVGALDLRYGTIVLLSAAFIWSADWAADSGHVAASTKEISLVETASRFGNCVNRIGFNATASNAGSERAV